MRTSKVLMVAGLVVVALLLGGGAGFLVSGAGKASESTSAIESLGDGHPHIVSTDQLTAIAPLVGVTYWAGERPNTHIELTVTSSAIYVRYLPKEQPPSQTAHVLTVATYRDVAGYQSLKALDKATLTDAQSGALVAVTDKSPLSTYFAFPSGSFEVEVYSPTTGESSKLVDDGSITPITAK